jgi:SNF2 family DNA or RNA helicase
MGLGKTIQALAYLAYLKDVKKTRGKHIIIVPLSTVGNWKKELDKWLPSLDSVVLYNIGELRDECLIEYIIPGRFDVIVTSYGAVSTCLNYLRRYRFECLILDEAHKIKNPVASFSKDMRRMKTNKKLLLTGTPIHNNIYELWALLNYMMPKLFKNEIIFINFFGENISEMTGAAKVRGNTANNMWNLRKTKYSKEELVDKIHTILAPLMLRRIKHDTDLKIPEKKEVLVKTKLNSQQQKWYTKILVEHRLHTKSTSKMRNVLMQLRKICLHPYLFEGIEPDGLPEYGYHLIKSSAKMKLLDRLLVKLKEEGRKVLIFSQFTSMLNILEDYCTYRKHQFLRLDGSTKGVERQTMINEFQAPDSESFLFLLSTRAGGLGINLTAADTVIIYDSDWNPQMDLQAMDRAHRIGQKNPVNVYRLVCENTIEEKIIER